MSEVVKRTGDEPQIGGKSDISGKEPQISRDATRLLRRFVTVDTGGVMTAGELYGIYPETSLETALSEDRWDELVRVSIDEIDVVLKDQMKATVPEAWMNRFGYFDLDWLTLKESDALDVLFLGFPRGKQPTSFSQALGVVEVHRMIRGRDDTVFVVDLMMAGVDNQSGCVFECRFNGPGLGKAGALNTWEASVPRNFVEEAEARGMRAGWDGLRLMVLPTTYTFTQVHSPATEAMLARVPAMVNVGVCAHDGTNRGELYVVDGISRVLRSMIRLNHLQDRGEWVMQGWLGNEVLFRYTMVDALTPAEER